jgi:hypothetical protein
MGMVFKNIEYMNGGLGVENLSGTSVPTPPQGAHGAAGSAQDMIHLIFSRIPRYEEFLI